MERLTLLIDFVVFIASRVVLEICISLWNRDRFNAVYSETFYAKCGDWRLVIPSGKLQTKSEMSCHMPDNAFTKRQTFQAPTSISEASGLFMTKTREQYPVWNTPHSSFKISSHPLSFKYCSSNFQPPGGGDFPSPYPSAPQAKDS